MWKDVLSFDFATSRTRIFGAVHHASTRPRIVYESSRQNVWVLGSDAMTCEADQCKLRERIPDLRSRTMQTISDTPKDCGSIDEPITFVIYAPFGDDPTLSEYPHDQTQRIEDHPLIEHAVAVSRLGVNVCALVDRTKDDTWLLTIPANGEAQFSSQLKCEMASPRTLRGLLELADRRFPRSTFVVSMEGHGAGYFPEIDSTKLNVASLTNFAGTPIEWVISPGQLAPRRTDNGLPALPMGEPMLPMGEPMLPASHLPISTWGIGWALREYVARRKSRDSNIAVINFNNCFNMSVELLHTVSRYAGFAVGYPNYNFFTAGSSYPKAFAAFFSSNSRSAHELAIQFAKSNRAMLANQAEPHPTVGCAIQLSRLPAIASALDALCVALIDSLPAKREQIVAAIAVAQQFDTRGDFQLEVPDELTDLASLAKAFKTAAISPQTTLASADLALALKDVFVYGERAKPWVAPQVEWRLDDPSLSMNIFLPDPTLGGLWDWRSPYYMETIPGRCVAQPEVIEFLQQTKWIPFLRKLHEAVPFVGLKAPRVLAHPIARDYPHRAA